MKNLKKISAFTLTEMLIVLAITTVVAGLAFSIITLFGKNIHAIQKNYQLSAESDLFEQQILIDFNKYHEIKLSNQGETMLLKTPLDSVRYSFYDELILRESDTIFNYTYLKTLFFKGEQAQQGIVDAIKIEFSQQNKPSFLFIYKESDATSNMTDNGN